MLNMCQRVLAGGVREHMVNEAAIIKVFESIDLKIRTRYRKALNVVQPEVAYVAVHDRSSARQSALAVGLVGDTWFAIKRGSRRGYELALQHPGVVVWATLDDSDRWYLGTHVDDAADEVWPG